jgi:lipid A 3-O-deacylase
MLKPHLFALPYRPHRKLWRQLLGTALLPWLLILAADKAAAAEPASIYAEAGQNLRSGITTRTATLGWRWPMQSSFWDGRITGAWDVYVSQWNADATVGQDRHYAQIGLVPMFRYRFDGGQSPWFVEAGVGLSYLDKTYYTPSGHFSTQWNFSDHLGLGRNFGAQQRHSLGVYVKHVSNAGLRQPNPGETFVQLRYSLGF